ncbi:MAG: hypothetical protein KGQ52_06400 [Alphaproteobacteria bacterium]|nr:hypothetical protein [Alphaproteobacteria bacterium]
MISLVFGVAGCSGSAVPEPAPAPTPASTPTPTSPASNLREIAPDATNAAITATPAPHIAVNPVAGVAAQGRLLVMLPGTGANPRAYRLILQRAAANGVHAIGLAYPNPVTIGDLCGPAATPACPGDVRTEIITGEDRSPLVSITPLNAIAGRLDALLAFLHNRYPDEGWGQYRHAGGPSWSRLRVAGHSQGAGHAALMGKLYTLDRIAMFGGFSDAVNAVWPALPNLTPISQIFGLAHAADELVPLALIQFNWNRMGLGAFGPPVNVDAGVPPFAGSRQFVTAAPANPTTPLNLVPLPLHSAMIVDVVTPLAADGSPALGPVWDIMLLR